MILNNIKKHFEIVYANFLLFKSIAVIDKVKQNLKFYPLMLLHLITNIAVGDKF